MRILIKSLFGIYQCFYMGILIKSLSGIYQFFMELMKVPRVEAKLRVFAFKITFSSQVYYAAYGEL